MNGDHHSKGIAIGIIGPEQLVQQILKVAQRFPSFYPIPKVYVKDEEAPALAGSLARDAEVLLFSGPLPYWRVRAETDPGIPLHYVPLTDTGLYRSLHRLRKVHRLGEMSGLSIDTLNKQMVESSLREIGETSAALYFYSDSHNGSHEQLVGFHKKNHADHAGLAALTAEPSVAVELTKLGIPCEWVIPTDQNIIVALERALLSTETRKSKEAQIVVGLINVDEFSKFTRNHSSEHDIQKLKLDLHRLFLDYVESLEGYLTPLGGDEYLFFTTRGIFERETGGYKFIPLAPSASKKFGLTLSIGIGFGISANQAGTHARSALRKAKEAGGNSCFIIREDRAIIGPLETAEPFEKFVSVKDMNRIKIAENAGMSSSYLVKLMNHRARTGKTDYNVQELANLLDITVRSIHRLLLEWTEQGIAEIAGMEKMPKGRPRQIFRISLLDD